MSAENLYVYVFVRQDIPVPLQLVHACHAVYHATQAYRPEEGIPAMVVIGCPDEKALIRVRAKLHGKQITHFCWADPDADVSDYLCVATVPLNEQRREHLKNYRLYSLGPVKTACGLTADEGASADLAQLRERSVFNGEVAGVNPAVGSNSVSY